VEWWAMVASAVKVAAEGLGSVVSWAKVAEALGSAATVATVFVLTVTARVVRLAATAGASPLIPAMPSGSKKAVPNSPEAEEQSSGRQRLSLGVAALAWVLD